MNIMRIKSILLGGAALSLALSFGLGFAAQAQELNTRWRGGPEFSNDDVSFKMRGRLLVDAVFQEVDRSGPLTDFQTRNIRGRQAFIGVEGKLNSKFAYKIEGGFVNGGTSSWDDAVIEYKPTETTSLMFGNIKAAGLENLTSTRFTEFMDRGPYGDMGVDSYLLGAVVKTNGPDWTLTGAVQGNSLNSSDINQGCVANVQGGAAVAGQGTTCNSKEQMVYTGRASYAPILTDDDKVHIAASVRYRERGNQSAFAYAIRPLTSFGTSGAYMTSSAIADKDTTIAGEAAWVHGPVSVQAEYADIQYNTFAGAGIRDGHAKVGYVFATWSPTGETRNYDAAKGEFGRTKILNPITAGGTGGIVLGLRYDYTDLSDAYTSSKSATNLAGKYNGVTAGITYYPISYVRFMINYTDGKFNNPVANSDIHLKQLQMRAQIDF
jgi:phosphate-selective porin OprO/OprP